MTDKNLLVITPHRKEPGKQRIAAYCRVSSRSDEQLNSLANQIDFYRSRFENDDTVVFVGIYAEEGLSGTQAESRPQFMKMIEDCRNGLIDCIWTKSVSRFGRNTVDTLIYIRELRTLGIDVFFEKENIHSTESSGELMLTLMAAFAESESETMSANMCLLIDEIGKINEFSYPLMLKTLDRVVVNANGKLTFIFQSGIKITV